MKRWSFVFLVILKAWVEMARAQTAPAEPPPALTPAQKKELSTYDFQGALKRLQSTPEAATPASQPSPGAPPAHPYPVPALDVKAPKSTKSGTASSIPAGWSHAKAEMNPTAITATNVAASWESTYNMPTPGADGRVVYAYGAGMPVVVCAPLRVCVVELEPGEHVESQPQIGDARRWEVTPISSGSGTDQTALLVVKPIEAGLDTDLVVPTDRRVYVLRLVSDASRYVSRVAFRYAADDHTKWSAFQATEDALKREANLFTAQEKASEERQKLKDKKDGVPGLAPDAIGRLYFDYKLTGAPSLRPERVVDDGQRTYLVYPADGRFRELPTLLIAADDKKPELVNFRVDGNRYIVDRLFDRGVLVVGVGKKQKKVTITRLHPFATGSGGKHGGE